MFNPVGGGSGCPGSTPGSEDSGGMDELWKLLVEGSELSDEQLSQLRKALMDKGYTQDEADNIIKNHGKLPNGETPEDIE